MALLLFIGAQAFVPNAVQRTRVGVPRATPLQLSGMWNSGAR